MEFTTKVYTHNGINPHYRHKISVTASDGDVVAKAIVWTNKPSQLEPIGHSRFMSFDVKIVEHAQAIHRALATELKNLGLHDTHMITSEVSSQKLARNRHHFAGFAVEKLEDNQRQLNIPLGNYLQTYAPTVMPVKPHAATPSVKAPTKQVEKIAKAPLQPIALAPKEDEINRVSTAIQSKTMNIEATRKFIKQLVKNTTKRDAQNVVFTHVFSSIPGPLVRYSSIISHANNTIAAEDFEGMASKLDSLPAEHARGLVDHVVRKTLEITTALELLRLHNLTTRVNREESSAMNALNREAIRLNHALNIGFLLTKHNRK